ncbi:MAG: HAD family phosphatase [SAR202 cluster bacterium]|nr:HAD family phosphatase [SAR202 cluster bacterium]
MSIDTLILDMGGVVVWTKWENVTRAWHDLTGLAPDEITKRMVAGGAYPPFMRGEIDRIEFHRRMCDDLGLEQDAAALFETWSSAIEPNRDIDPLIAKLKGRVRLAIGSNTDELHNARGLEVQPALGLFDDFVLSFEIGALKPDAKFYHRALTQLGVRAEQCFFTDDRQNNVDTANAVGIRSVLFESPAQLESELTEIGIL